MKRRSLLAIFSAAVVVLCLVAGVIAQRSSSSSKEPVAETQWEYLVVAGGSVNLTSEGLGSSRMRKQPDDSFAQEAYGLERNFDKLGAQGWQMVAVHGAPNNPVYYFKRLKERP
ncbi:MAG: hypothetical protein HYR56_07345 [Acidobacteria bacterium]|nr:hypothetical protein [Acidobacteriota bacterium]MBI3425146.1 hypothetical protein [Acidobacteriota bacterium]